MSPSSIFHRGPLRFGLLIAFIILAAALARLADLPTGWILAVIAISWLLAALIERSAHRSARAAKAAGQAAGTAATARLLAARLAERATPAAATPADASGPAPAAAPAPVPAAAPAPAAPPPARAGAGAGAGAGADLDLWLDGEAVIDPAPAPIVPWSRPATARGAEREPAAATEPESGPESPAAGEPEPELALPAPPMGVPSSALPRGSWNLWELEAIARDASGKNAAQDEERSLILMYLREFASAEGVLAPSFDDLVRESFGDLLPQR